LFKDGYDFDAVEAAAEPPYALPNIHVDYVRVEPPGVRTAWWRGVGPTHNVFVVESFMDELAHAAKQDPVAYRKRCSPIIREPSLFCRLLQKKQGGDHHFPHGMAAGFRTIRIRKLHVAGRRGRSGSRWRCQSRADRLCG